MIYTVNYKLLTATALAIAGCLLGLVLTNSVIVGLCVSNETMVEASCINFYERVGDPLMYGMGALAVVFLALIFVPSAWAPWKKFAIWFVPLATILFIIYPDTGANFWRPAPEQIFQWVSGLYVLVSLFVISLTAYRK